MFEKPWNMFIKVYDKSHVISDTEMWVDVAKTCDPPGNLTIDWDAETITLQVLGGNLMQRK